MTKRKRDIRLSEEDSGAIVKLDKNSPVLQSARNLLVRVVIKERLAMLAKIQAQALLDSEVGDTASGIWEEMPRMAREREASLVDGDAEGEGFPGAEETEFDEYGGVTAC